MPLTLAGLEFADPVLSESVREGLDRVERRLLEAVGSDFDLVGEPARYLVEAGGKRFRPLLTLLAAHLGDPAAPGVVEAAVVVELTHLATLYHDDVMDEASVRRGAESANSRPVSFNGNGGPPPYPYYRTDEAKIAALSARSSTACGTIPRTRVAAAPIVTATTVSALGTAIVGPSAAGSEKYISTTIRR